MHRLPGTIPPKRHAAEPFAAPAPVAAEPSFLGSLGMLLFARSQEAGPAVQ